MILKLTTEEVWAIVKTLGDFRVCPTPQKKGSLCPSDDSDIVCSTEDCRGCWIQYFEARNIEHVED
jgi:hypothetical protein